MRATNLLAALVGLLALLAGAGAGAATHALRSDNVRDVIAPCVTVVDVREAPNEMRLAAQAASGLMNRAQPASAYVIMTEDDAFWQQELLSTETGLCTESVPAETFVQTAAARFGVILYAASNAKATLDAVVTLAGVLDAIPLQIVEDSNVTVKADAREWTLARALAESEAVVAHTTSLAVQESELLMEGQLVDFLVKERIFVNFLAHECVPLTREHAYLKRVVDKAPWRRPVRVYGYNTQMKILGGDTFEAETGCLPTLGQIATHHTHNLAFWSGREGVTAAFQQKRSEHIVYDRETAYVAIVYGDMDNLDFVQGFGRDHMRERADRCASAPETCFPLTWTVSPNLLRLAPDILKWYMAAGARSGNDWFIFPPSGTLYAYPGMFSDADQEAYVRQMDADARLLDTSGSVHWEWFYRWTTTFKHYFPRYATGEHAVKSFFLNDVPWPVPIPDMAVRGETYRVVRGSGDSASAPVVAFRPAFNWAPGNPSGGLDVSPASCAWLMGQFAPGSVQYVYTIQTTEVEDLFALAAQLPAHVRLVSYEQLADLALQREAAIRNKSVLRPLGRAVQVEETSLA